MHRTRAERRAFLEKAKRKTIRMFRLVWRQPDLVVPDLVGHYAATHRRPCSCWMCKQERYKRTTRTGNSDATFEFTNDET